MIENTYWNGEGKHQVIADTLRSLIPTEGSVPHPRKNKALEKFRKASNCYYDLHNNGLMNRADEFRRVFGIQSSRFRCHRGFDDDLYQKVEEKMDEIIEAAYEEQKDNFIEGV